MRPDEQLEIIVDRRSGEPSNDWDPAQDRRRRPQVDLALKANGFAVVPAPSQGGRRTPTSLLVPSAPSSDVGFDGGYNGVSNGGFDGGDDDEERLEAIRSFKRERSSNLVPWLIAALIAVAAVAFILSPTGHALKQTVAQHMSTDTTSSSSATNSSNPPAPAPPANPAPAPQARAPVVADKPPAANAPARAPATETPQVDRPLRGPASPPEPAPPREAARVDPSRDAEKFRSVSPVAQAERLKAPVLLAFGGFDQRVPIKNGNALRAALDQHGKKYEWVVYPNEGHGFGDEKNRFDYYRKVDAFLRQNLAPLP